MRACGGPASTIGGEIRSHLARSSESGFERPAALGPVTIVGDRIVSDVLIATSVTFD